MLLDMNMMMMMVMMTIHAYRHRCEFCQVRRRRRRSSGKAGYLRRPVCVTNHRFSGHQKVRPKRIGRNTL